MTTLLNKNFLSIMEISCKNTKSDVLPSWLWNHVIGIQSSIFVPDGSVLAVRRIAHNGQRI
jgi:hypothetical protein